MLQDLQGAVFLCVQDLHIQTSHSALSRLLVFSEHLFWKIRRLLWLLWLCS